DAWVENCSIDAVTGPGLTRELQSAITEAWQPSTGAGPVPMTSLPARIGSATGTDPAQVLVQWAIRYRDDGIYSAIYNDADPPVARARVQLAFVPGARRPPPAALRSQPSMSAKKSTTSVEALDMATQGPLHKGHAAVDFGTSNCTTT